MIEVIVVLGYVILIGVLLFTNKISVGGIRYLGAKVTLSLVFCLIAFLMAWWQHHWLQFFTLLPALLACLGGDVILGIYNRRRKHWLFAVGLLLFLLAHLGFLYAFGNNTWYWQFGIFPIVSIVGVMVLSLWPRMKMGWMTFPIILYVAVITLMVQKATQLFINTQQLAGLLLMVGSWLFLLSDVLLLFLYFMHRPSKWLHSSNLILYYLAMLLIVMSIRF
jgi:uncharacterized membrane protein YhhN